MAYRPYKQKLSEMLRNLPTDGQGNVILSKELLDGIHKVKYGKPIIKRVPDPGYDRTKGVVRYRLRGQVSRQELPIEQARQLYSSVLAEIFEPGDYVFLNRLTRGKRSDSDSPSRTWSEVDSGAAINELGEEVGLGRAPTPRSVRPSGRIVTHAYDYRTGGHLWPDDYEPEKE